MLIALIAGIILGGFTVLFALDNLALVTVTFLAWKVSLPLGIVMLMCMLGGIAFTLLLMLPSFVRDELQKRALKREKRILEDAYASYRVKNPEPTQTVSEAIA